MCFPRERPLRDMKCPSCKSQLETIDFKSVKVERCPSCGGLWFDDHELHKAQRTEDPFLGFLHVDPWENPDKFKLAPGSRVCPKDQLPLYRATYDGSDITVDVCQDEHGMWLDQDDWRAILDWAHAHLAQDSFGGYLKHLGEEFAEVFSGHGTPAQEAKDIWVVTKLISYKFLSKAPILGRMISQLPT